MNFFNTVDCSLSEIPKISLSGSLKASLFYVLKKFRITIKTTSLSQRTRLVKLISLSESAFFLDPLSGSLQYLIMPTTGVDDDDFEALLLEHVDTVGGNDNGIGLCVATVERDTSLR